MNESETRAELIDPKLKAAGWGVVDGSRVLREYIITDGKVQAGGRGRREIADYVLVYKGIKLAVVEAKSADLEVGEGVMQAKQYADKLQLDTTYSTNGKAIYQICMKTGDEGLVDDFLSPDALWHKTFAEQNEWREKFASVPFEDKSGSWQLRYYQEIAVKNTLEAIANQQNRILLTLATGTGKTAIAFQIAWKLFQTRWSLQRDGVRRPRVLFLADRNILANQAFNDFSSFPDGALVRIKPTEIKKNGRVPTNGSVFFTIFQTFMSGMDEAGQSAPYFGAYPPDYFDLIIIDECHRGGANDEGSWRGILEYFAPAVQLGLTATPKRRDNADTYAYFGEPVYVYSLKEGINDGFLTPFKVRRIQTTLDDYIYTSDDEVVEGEVEAGKRYEEKDFNRSIEIVEREAYRVRQFLSEANPNEKSIIFCATQSHAALIRDLVNQYSGSKNPFYCVRVTANDGEEGERWLREFQDNERSIPTVLTTSQKLSTGVNARNVRNVVLMRPVNSMIEFKQIVGRGTRLFDGKVFFTIYDFVGAYMHFSDPEWDGEPLEPEPITKPEPKPVTPPTDTDEKDDGDDDGVKRGKVKVKLRDGKEREIQSMSSTLFWSADGRPISAEEFLNNLFGELPKLFKDEHELRLLWSQPMTRRALLAKLDEAGFGQQELAVAQKLIDAEQSDLFDVLEYIFDNQFTPITRKERVDAAQAVIFSFLDEVQKEFISFVLSKYVETGVDELDQDKLPILLANKYDSIEDAKKVLGDVADIKKLFVEFQAHLYEFS
jgi:type I restriction enzyme R subunit